MPLTSITPTPQIDILLPAKERFSPSNAGAISGVVRDLARTSKATKQFRVIGTNVETSLMPEHFTGLMPKRRWLNGQNIGLAASYLDLINATGVADLVEVHEDPAVARSHRVRGAGGPVFFVLPSRSPSNLHQK